MSLTKLVLDDYLPYRLSVASNAVSSLISTAYDTLYGLKVPEWRLIWVLSEDGPSTQQALVRRTGMDKVTISRAAQGLARQRLVTRAPHERDGRSHHLILTNEGRKLFEDVAPSAVTFETEVLAGLSAKEVETLKDLLRRVEEAALKARD